MVDADDPFVFLQLENWQQQQQRRRQQRKQQWPFHLQLEYPLDEVSCLLIDVSMPMTSTATFHTQTFILMLHHQSRLFIKGNSS